MSHRIYTPEFKDEANPMPASPQMATGSTA